MRVCWEIHEEKRNGVSVGNHARKKNCGDKKKTCKRNFIMLQTSPLKLGEQGSHQDAKVTFLPLLSTFSEAGCCSDDVVGNC